MYSSFKVFLVLTCIKVLKVVHNTHVIMLLLDMYVPVNTDTVPDTDTCTVHVHTPLHVVATFNTTTRGCTTPTSDL